MSSCNRSAKDKHMKQSEAHLIPGMGLKGPAVRHGSHLVCFFRPHVILLKLHQTSLELCWTFTRQNSRMSNEDCVTVAICHIGTVTYHIWLWACDTCPERWCLSLELAATQIHRHLEVITSFSYMNTFFKCEPFCEEHNIYEPISDWFTQLVHKYEPFLHLWTFSKKIHKLCLKTPVVTSRFMNRFLGTLLFMVSFFTKGS